MQGAYSGWGPGGALVLFEDVVAAVYGKETGRLSRLMLGNLSGKHESQTPRAANEGGRISLEIR